ncbi:MAG: competence/damage-inducible protein A [Oscillospiraceae bacterium]|jgi:nicotinamide-nucleotide amidase|nr:competence/damage-inducible protein A [Oscillospiraceae bacterium]
MTCEIIAVGTELLLGGVANTDARDISQGLAETGIRCYFHTTVGDNPGRLKEALRIAKGRADIIITTGGLGPTCDDLTKQTVCEAFGLPLELHQPTWEKILSFFKAVGRPVTENNRQQAMIPVGGILLENDWGTAPGCGFQKDGLWVFMLPGPPKECRPLFQNCLMPILRSFSDTTIASRNIRVFGMGESAVEDRLRPLMEGSRNPTLAPYAQEGEVTLRVTASAATKEDAIALIDPMVSKVTALLGDVVYGVDTGALEEVVLTLLNSAGVRLAVAESCTGGLVSARLTSVPGASKRFLGGVVAYARSVKETLLGVDGQVIDRYGMVSEQVAAAMAEGVCKATSAELGLGITGLAGPSGDGSETPVGTVCIALCDARTGVATALTRNFGDERGRIRNMAALTALDMVRRLLTLPGILC